MSDFGGLASAINATVATSAATSDLVVGALSEVAADLAPGFAELNRRHKTSGRLCTHLDKRLEVARDSIDMALAHALDRQSQLSDFRVAMFGRTGVGKSSL